MVWMSRVGRHPIGRRDVRRLAVDRALNNGMRWAGGRGVVKVAKRRRGCGGRLVVEGIRGLGRGRRLASRRGVVVVRGIGHGSGGGREGAGGNGRPALAVGAHHARGPRRGGCGMVIRVVAAGRRARADSSPRWDRAGRCLSCHARVTVHHAAGQTRALRIYFRVGRAGRHVGMVRRPDGDGGGACHRAPPVE